MMTSLGLELTALRLILFFLGIPALLTVCNVLLLFLEKKWKPVLVNVVDGSIFVLGISFTTLYAVMADFNPWYKQLYVGGGRYSPIAPEMLPTFLTLCTVAVVGYLLLRFLGKKLAPLVAALCYGGVFLGLALVVMLAVQMATDITDTPAILLLLFPFNYVLCAVRLMRGTVAQYAEQMAQTQHENRFLRWCQRFVSKSTSFLLTSFLLAVPLLLVIVVILLLFGQQPDAVVKMFTETAEWTLSQKIPPPRLDYEGHYLCTVAACGDEKVVKPLRAGKRRGELIVVNRQLLVANAFEDLLAEKAPRLHRIIRKTYDRIGLPISKYITTKRRSNAVYYLMKPLEWLFLVVLYTFDRKPENRICSQYLG